MENVTPQKHVNRPSLIEIKNVSKFFKTRKNHVHAVDNVSLNVEQEEFLSIVGPSGCGKSTLLKMIAGLIPATDGVIQMSGSIVKGPRTDLGIVFQRDLLLDWKNILDNVLVQATFRGLSINDYRPRAQALLELVGLTGFENQFPFELSGGMRQRVSLCRALLHNPKLLLMDEPFGALDALTREQLNLDLQRIWQQDKKTVVFVTHSITEAVFLGDQVVVMGPRPGQIITSLPINLSRPRRLGVRETSLFAEYIHQIRQIFRDMGFLQD